MIKNIFKKKTNPKMRIVTEHLGLYQIEDCIPKSGNHFFPPWLKSLKKKITNEESDVGTIKNCPVIPEYLTQGVVIPMWTDTTIYADDNGWEVNTSAHDFIWSSHNSNQYLDYLPDHVNPNDYVVLKAKCPWFIITSPGYSCYQQDLYYHYNDDFFVLPGTINTDHHHTISQQVLVKKHKKITITRGTPFAWYIPYKREKYDISSGRPSEEEQLKIFKSVFDVDSKWTGSYKKRAKEIKKCPFSN
jgi:hypothetical protein